MLLGKTIPIVGCQENEPAGPYLQESSERINYESQFKYADDPRQEPRTVLRGRPIGVWEGLGIGPNDALDQALRKTLADPLPSCRCREQPRFLRSKEL